MNKNTQHQQINNWVELHSSCSLCAAVQFEKKAFLFENKFIAGLADSRGIYQIADADPWPFASRKRSILYLESIEEKRPRLPQEVQKQN